MFSSDAGINLTRVDSEATPGVNSGGIDKWAGKLERTALSSNLTTPWSRAFAGATYLISARVYSPSSNTAVNAMKLFAVFGGASINSTIEDSWELLSAVRTVTVNPNISVQLNTATVGDVGYIDSMSVIRQNSISLLQGWTSPNGILTYDLPQPATGVVPFGAIVRYTDALNYWEVRVKPNTAGTDTQIVEVVAGTETVRAGAAVGWTAGQTDQMRITLSGTSIAVEQKKYGANTWTTATSYASMATGGTSSQNGIMLYDTSVNRLDKFSITTGSDAVLTGWSLNGPTTSDAFTTFDTSKWTASVGTATVNSGKLQGTTQGDWGNNLVVNPEFTTNTNSWGPAGGTLTRVDSVTEGLSASGGDNNWVGKFVLTTGAGKYVAQLYTNVAGAKYISSARIYIPTTNAAPKTGHYYVDTDYRSINANDAWTFYTNTATTLTIYFQVDISGGTTGDVLYFDAAKRYRQNTILLLSGWTSPNALLTYDLLQPATGVVPFGAIVRYTDALNYWEVRVKPNTTGTDTQIVEVAAGVETVRGVGASVAWTAGQTDQMRITLDGAAIIVEQKKYGASAWTAATSYTTMSTGTTSAQTGLMFYDTGVNRLDNFSIAPIQTGTRDTTTKYAGTASVQLVGDGYYSQSINVGDTLSYLLTAYAYKGIGQTITTADINLFYDSSTITTNFTDMGNDWYKLTGTVTGENTSKNYGVSLGVGKSLYVDNISLTRYESTGTITSAIYDGGSGGSYWGTITAIGETPTGTSIYFKTRTSDSATMIGATSFDSCTTIASNTDISTNNCVTDGQRYVQYQTILTTTVGQTTPTLNEVNLTYAPFDRTAPTTQATVAKFKRNSSATPEYLNNDTSPPWTKDSAPYFSWTDGLDNENGSGIRGYCLYLGQEIDATPNQDGGLLNSDNSPISTSGTDPLCQFIISTPYINFSNANSAYRNTNWLVASSDHYYLKIWAVDVAGNVQTTNPARITFRFDNIPPTNVSYISPASGNFSNVVDMSFSWPTSVGVGSSDIYSDILGWQYQLNSTTGTWKGTTTDSALGLTYIPSGTASYNLQIGETIVSGNNIVYFRTVDKAGNFSSDATIRTGNISYGGAAPDFGGSDIITVTPDTNTSNLFALSWPRATATVGQTISHYYYMVKTSPPSTLETLQGNPSTYIDVGTSLSIPETALANVNKGTNNVYVVAIDNADPPNYSPSNYIMGSFTLDSDIPDNVGNLVASDSSIKSLSQWNVTLTWGAPTYQGAGNLTYLIYRSTDGITFAQTGTTSGLSYVDNTPLSKLYYYKVYTKDGALATSSGTNAVSITPTGKWTSAPSLDTQPSAGSITTKKATITWTTSRSSDSKIQYGTTSKTYGSDEVSNSSQVSSHSVNLTNLKAGTTYYYKAKWTDEDGNTGTSDEKTFTTASAPTVKDVSAKNIGLSSAIIQFTTKDASKVKIYYGTSTSFGGIKEISTSTIETIYTAELSGLTDGTKYYYKINTFDSDGSEYDNQINDFTTLPRPRITSVRLEQVANTAQSTIRVTWSTNTEVSSIVTYYPESDPLAIRDEVKVALEKGAHSLIIRGFIPETNYLMVVKGRDKLGNEASSEIQRFTTATDTRPPSILGLKVQGGTIPPVGFAAGEVKAQLVISWETDERATSQVEFGEGTGNTYGQKSQEDGNLTTNHTVILSNLTPSQVYHMRAISKDSAGNMAQSIDTVTIAPKATKSALDLVIKNLSEAFTFVNGIRLK